MLIVLFAVKGLAAYGYAVMMARTGNKSGFPHAPHSSNSRSSIGAAVDIHGPMLSLGRHMANTKRIQQRNM